MPSRTLASIALLAALLAGCKRASPPKGDTPGFGPQPTQAPTTPGKPGKTDPAPAPAPKGGGKGRSTSVHLSMGIPTDDDASDDHLVVKRQYALSYNQKLNDPNWVSWNLNATHFGSVPRFSGKFMPDESLPAGMYRVRHEDYSNSGYDRGHMVRSEERTATDEDNKATFFTVNLLPQYHDLNAGPWLRLEEYCQRLAQRESKELFIVAGGIFDRRPKTIGKGVAVPRSTFKIVVVLDRGKNLESVTKQTRVIAVDMPNEQGIMSEGWAKYRTTVDAIEKATGYDFLTDVPSDVQSAIESRKDDGPT